jgi:phosphomannomutase/phosphoglucomutase
LSNEARPLSRIVEELPRYVTSPEIKAHCADAVKYGVIEHVTERLKSLYPERVDDVCGARVSFDHGWGLVRASSNMPEMVIIFEGDTEAEMLRIRSVFKDILGAFPEIDPEWENDVGLGAL